MLATSELCFRYQDAQILHNISIDFSDYPVSGLVGANGCGKSTLFMNLCGLLRPQTGQVSWQANPLEYSKKGLIALRQRVVTVFQDPDSQLFYTDIDSDISFSLRNLGIEEAEISRRLEQALTLVDAHAFRYTPVQYLSHGQKKRVAIAGALVMQPDYLLLDEPTAGLDPRGREQMIAIIQRVAEQGKHVVISSHDLDLIYEVCQGVYVMQQGQIVASGTPETVFSQRQMLQDAGLAQPWLMKMHQIAGLPLFRRESDLLNYVAQQQFQEQQ